MIEKAGIPTVSVSVLREVTEKVSPPRVLFADRPLGHPLGAPNDAPMQIRTIRAALSLLSRPVEEPLIQVFDEA